MPIGEMSVQTEPEHAPPSSPKPVMVSMDILTDPESELKPEASSSTAKGNRRLSGGLPPAYEQDEWAQAVAATMLAKSHPGAPTILTDDIPSGILTSTAADWTKLEQDLGESSHVQPPPPPTPPAVAKRTWSSGRSRPRSQARLPTFFCAWAPPPPSCSSSGTRRATYYDRLAWS
jgi:hypothetical protein